MPSGESSRKGKSIARKACDLCRERKVQCAFDADNTVTCRKCAAASVQCTFFKSRKPRGPPSRRVIEAQERANAGLSPKYASSQVDSPRFPQRLPLPIGQLTVEHLCPVHMFKEIIQDFLDMVYPLVPVVHIPTFKASFENRVYETHPPFFRLCISLAAATIASFPRKISAYGCGLYADAGDMVDRACHVVLSSRLTTGTTWQNIPSVETMVSSVVLALASHYTRRANQGWTYAGEAILFFRGMELYRREGYDGLGVIETEICKRCFWLLFIIQTHDRLSFIIPHTGLSYDPIYTDWEFLVPLEADDEHLSSLSASPAPSSAVTSPSIANLISTPKQEPLKPVISGFIALTRVFQCVVDLLSMGFMRTAPQPYAMASSSLGRRSTPVDPNLLPVSPGSGLASSPGSMHYGSVGGATSLDRLSQMMKRLSDILHDLPEELRLPARQHDLLSPQLHQQQQHQASSSYNLPLPPQLLHHGGQSQNYQSNLKETAAADWPRSYQFEAMRANVHITSLYMQSTILENYSDTLQRPTPQSGDRLGNANGEVDFSTRAHLWKYREGIAREMLDVLNSCSPSTLEANGTSMVKKIREIAATLLNREGDQSMLSDIEERSRQYITQFVEILADLDYTSRIPISPYDKSAQL